MNSFEIIPSRLSFKSAPILDQQVSIDLLQTQKELTQYVRNNALSLAQLYQDERQASFRFRPTFKIQYLYKINFATQSEQIIAWSDNIWTVALDVENC